MDEPSSQPLERPMRLLEIELGTTVLTHLSKLEGACILTSRPEPRRRSHRKAYAANPLYRNPVSMGHGLMGQSHRHVAVACVLEGELSFAIGKEFHQVRAGDWLMLEPGIPRGGCHLQPDVSYGLLTMTFAKHVVDLTMERYAPESGYQIADACRTPPLRTNEQAILEHFIRHPAIPLPDVRRQLLRLTLIMLDALSFSPPVYQAHPLIRQAEAILMASLHQPPTVTELADRIGLSPNYLSGLFRKETGRTICQFIQGHRIEWAKRALDDPNQPVKEIAFQLGFADPQHFSHAFHRVTGMNPSEYRRERARKRSFRQ